MNALLLLKEDHLEPLKWRFDRIVELSAKFAFFQSTLKYVPVERQAFNARGGRKGIYTSIDTLVNSDDAINYPVELLNSLKPPGLPYHRLILRVGTLIMFLRNLKPPNCATGPD
ncbi:hypothetical protein EVAR_48629_1 [Eumeta japonica]|uniref:DNA helicase Pif1-like 2B domain-containing protein n=1 Tax=Eumeta variegata TaxID=151549 RepID=A0A4C1XQ93_EUMVA|nr:hypothetical protein EVAR_48629_1 [Eumeta japonica]